MLLLLLVVLILTLIYRKINKDYEHWEKRGVKYLKPTFFFGNVARSMLQKESFYTSMLTYYNAFPKERYMGIFEFTKPILMIHDPDLIKSIFVKDFEHFIDHRPFVPDDCDPIWAKNLFSLRGAKWKDMRSALSPAFTSSKMRNIFVLINETIDTHMDYLSQNKIKKIEIKDTFSRFTNDVIASVAFGIKVDSINNRNDEFYAMAKRFTTFGLRETIIFTAYGMCPKLTKLMNISISPSNVRQFLNDVIMETVRVREEKGTYRPDMISLLMEEKKQREEAGEVLSNDEIVAQAFIFLFAGFDTVSNALTFCAYELSRNPEIQAKLQREIDDTLLVNGKLTYESLTQMKYMEQVISEVLRLWPQALAGDRICTKPYTIEPTNPMEKRIELKPGDMVWMNTAGILKDPEHFPNPDVFDPERFNDENKGSINPYTYLPFGIGPRICIGMRLALMEVKAFLFNLLSKYTFVATSSKPVELSKSSFDLRIDGEVWIELKPRE